MSVYIPLVVMHLGPAANHIEDGKELLETVVEMLVDLQHFQAGASHRICFRLGKVY